MIKRDLLKEAQDESLKYKNYNWKEISEKDHNIFDGVIAETKSQLNKDSKLQFTRLKLMKFSSSDYIVPTSSDICIEMIVPGREPVYAQISYTDHLSYYTQDKYDQWYKKDTSLDKKSWILAPVKYSNRTEYGSKNYEHCFYECHESEEEIVLSIIKNAIRVHQDGNGRGFYFHENSSLNEIIPPKSELPSLLIGVAITVIIVMVFFY